MPLVDCGFCSSWVGDRAKRPNFQMWWNSRKYTQRVRMLWDLPDHLPCSPWFVIINCTSGQSTSQFNSVYTVVTVLTIEITSHVPTWLCSMLEQLASRTRGAFWLCNLARLSRECQISTQIWTRHASYMQNWSSVFCHLWNLANEFGDGKI